MQTAPEPKDSPVTDQIGARIKARRTELGWSLRDLQQRTGINNSAIHRIETGQIQPRMEKVARLAEALDVTVAELVHGPEHPDRALPGFRDYLSVRYPDLLPGHLDRLERHFNRVLKEAGLSEQQAGEEA